MEHPCHRVRSLVGEKLTALEARLRDLKSLRRELRSTLTEWDALLRKNPRGKQVRLLERFGLSHPTRRGRNVLPRGDQKRER